MIRTACLNKDAAFTELFLILRNRKPGRKLTGYVWKDEGIEGQSKINSMEVGNLDVY
jgi:hypothetical protein